jgi:hypothetical protein
MCADAFGDDVFDALIDVDRLEAARDLLSAKNVSITMGRIWGC